MLNKDDNEGFDCGVVSDGMPSPVLYPGTGAGTSL